MLGLLESTGVLKGSKILDGFKGQVGALGKAFGYLDIIKNVTSLDGEGTLKALASGARDLIGTAEL